MAMAVQRLFKDAQVTIGPWIDRGFYYDFDLKEPLSDKDLKRIKKEMAKIIKMDLPFIREEVRGAGGSSLGGGPAAGERGQPACSSGACSRRAAAGVARSARSACSAPAVTAALGCRRRCAAAGSSFSPHPLPPSAFR